MVPDDGFILPIRTVPGGLNFYRSGTRERIEPLNIVVKQSFRFSNGRSKKKSN